MGLARPGRHAGQRDAKLFVYAPQIASHPASSAGRAWPGPYEGKSLLFFKTIGISLHMGLAKPGRRWGANSPPKAPPLAGDKKVNK